MTVATETVDTVIVAVPVFPSLVAVIVAVPAPVAVTTPVEDTVATAVALVVQVIARPVSSAPLASKVFAANGVVWPIVSAALGGDTVTDATGAPVTLTVAVPLFPSLDAVIVAAPTFTSVAIAIAQDSQINTQHSPSTARSPEQSLRPLSDLAHPGLA